MRVRSLVSSAIVLGAVLGTSALVTEAMAQKGTVMAPSTAWAINSVKNPAGSYCALARRFNQDTVLTMARNTDSETSFALDFERPVFTRQSSFNIILDPGAGQQRAFKVRPVSNKAFVIKLGRDGRFFDAMTRTGVLRVEIAGQSYHFNVADIDAGQSQLDACLVNMVMPAAGEEAPTQVISSVQASASQAQIDKAVADAGRSFRQEINALRNQINTLRNQNRELSGRIQAPAEPVSLDTAELDALKVQIQNLEDSNASLKRQLADAAKPDVEVVRPVQDVDESVLANLRAENARLKAELQTATPDNAAEIAALEAEIKTLVQRNQDLRQAAEVQSNDQNDLSTYRTKIASLEQQNEDLNTQLQQITKDVRQEFHGRIAELEAANQELNAAQINAQELDVLKNDRSADIAALEQQVATLKSENAEKDKALVEVGQSMADLQALREKNLSLTEQLAAQQSQAQETPDLMARLTVLENENNRLKTELENAPEDQSAVLAELRAENERLQSQIKANTGSQEQNVAALQQQIDSLNAEKVALEGKVADTLELQSSLEAAQADNDALRSQLSEKETELASLEGLRDELAELKAKQIDQSNDNSAELADLQQSNSSLKTKNEELAQQRDELKSSLRDVIKLAEAYKATNAEQESAIAALEKEKGQLTAQLDAKDDEIKVALASAQEANSKEAVVLDQNATFDDVVKAMPEPTKPKKQTQPKAQPKSAPAQVAKATAPAPNRKPAAPQKVATQEQVQPDPMVDEVKVSESTSQKDALGYTLEEVATEIAATDPADTEKMERLQREYASLEALQEQEKARVANEAMVEPAQEVASVMPMIEEPVYSADDVAAMAEMNEAQRHEYRAKLAADSLRAQKIAAVQKPKAEPVREPETITFKEPVPEVKQEEVTEIALNENSDPFEGMEVQDLDGDVSEPEVRMAESTSSEAQRQEQAMKGNAVQPVEAAQSPTAMPQGQSIKDIVTMANVTTSSSIKQVKENEGNVVAAYQWNGGSIYGSAEQKPLNSPDQFDALVQDYLERTQNRCPGEFAIVPDSSVGEAGARADAYEVACVGQDVSSGASLLFFNQGGTFTVVAHEAPTEELGTAMSYRNQVMRVVTNGSAS